MKNNIKSVLAAISLCMLIPVEAKADRGACADLWDEAEAQGLQIAGEPKVQVIGNGRLYLHSGPSEECIKKDTFVVPGDVMMIYVLYKDWITVKYENPKTKNYVLGWVKANRVLPANK